MMKSRKFFIENQISIYTLIILVLVLLGALNIYEITFIRKLILIIAVIGVFHEWEEKEWSAGFFNILGPLWGWDMDKVDTRVPGRWVVYAWMVVVALPMIFDDMVAFALIPLFLGIFETFIHTAARKITGISSKYFPGVITAWIYGIASVWCIVVINKEYGITATDCLIGFALIVVIFMSLQALAQRSAGHSIPKMIAAMRNRNK